MSRLMFEDWIAREEHKLTDWVAVGQCGVRDDAFAPLSVSALLTNDEQQVTRLFDRDAGRHWPHGLGKPGFELEDGSLVYYADSAGSSDLAFRGFCFGRSFPHTYGSHLELLQEFVVYHNACYDMAKQEWIGFDEDASDSAVARRRDDRAVTRIEVSVDALRDFLAASGCVLVRWHDLWRETPATGLSLNEEGVIPRRETRDGTRLYDVSVAPSPSRTGHALGRLLGFDIVFPYDEVPAKRRWWGEGQRSYEDFIAGVDETGRDVLHTCDPRRVGYRVEGDVTGSSLTPVFFGVEVLDRYRRDPSRFCIEDGIVRGGAWLISYDINPEELIQVWLKDLGLIPYREQKHWRVHNVQPAGGISRARFTTDIMGQFTDETADLSVRMREAYDKANHSTRTAWGFLVFRPLADSDRHVAAKIGWPIPDHDGDLDEQVGALAKLLCDSIDSQGIEAATGPKMGKEGRPLTGNNNRLEAALEHAGCASVDVKQVMEPLRALQRLRNAGAAHRRGDNGWEDACRRAGIIGLGPRKAWDKVLADVTESLLALAACVRPLATRPDDAGPPA